MQQLFFYFSLRFTFLAKNEINMLGIHPLNCTLSFFQEEYIGSHLLHEDLLISI